MFSVRLWDGGRARYLTKESQVLIRSLSSMSNPQRKLLARHLGQLIMMDTVLRGVHCEACSKIIVCRRGGGIFEESQALLCDVEVWSPLLPEAAAHVSREYPTYLAVREVKNNEIQVRARISCRLRSGRMGCKAPRSAVLPAVQGGCIVPRLAWRSNASSEMSS